jgi:ribosome biogenesis protein ERB1
MAATDDNSNSKKRKKDVGEVIDVEPLHEAIGLEMLSDEEDDEEPEARSDDEVDDFPEIDARSDSESEEESAEEDQFDDDDYEEDDDSDDSELHIFPKAKTVVSGITGQPKRVYPEIDPEYDSDSSTEDVRSPYPSLSPFL